MAPVYVLLMLLPAVAYASISIRVSGKDNDISFKLEGDEIGIISDEEKKNFYLTDNNVKRGVEVAFGRWPTDAYLRSPTPWGDLYTYDGFHQVTRILKPISGRVVKINGIPAILKKQCFENNSKYNVSTDTSISQTVSKTVSTSWSQSNQLSLSRSIGLEVNAEIAKVSGNLKFGYSFKWGESTAESQTETVSATAGFALVLPPYSSLLGTLESTKGSVTLEVEYEASFSGHVAVNYESTYQGRHFWGIDINEVLRGANLPTTMKYKSTHEIGFFSNSNVVMTTPRGHDCDSL